MAINYFNVNGGVSVNGLKIISLQDVPYGAGDGVEDSDLSSLPIGSLASDLVNGNIYFKYRDTQNSIEDYKVISSTGLTDLVESVDFIVDDAGDTAEYTAWASANPNATETFLNTTTGIMYVGNGTGIPDIHQTAIQLTNKRVATRDANIIYKCSGSDAIQDTENGLLSVNDTFFTYSEEIDGNTAIFQWNGTTNIKVSDVDWALATGINLSGSYTVDLDETIITTGTSVEDAIESIDGKLQNLKTVPPNTNISSGTITTVDTITLPLSELREYKFYVIIIKVGTFNAYQGELNDVCYNNGGTVITLSTATFGELNTLDVTPVVTTAGSGNDLLLRVTLTGYTSGTYTVRIIRQRLR